MKKFFKNLFWLGFFSAITYYAFKFYQKISSVISMNKTLPQYLENVIGERPKVNLTINLTKSKLKLLFSQETLDKQENLEEMITEYIDDFYPIFSNGQIEVEIAAKNEYTPNDVDNEETAEEDEKEVEVEVTPEKEETDFDD